MWWQAKPRGSQLPHVIANSLDYKTPTYLIWCNFLTEGQINQVLYLLYHLSYEPLQFIWLHCQIRTNSFLPEWVLWNRATSKLCANPLDWLHISRVSNEYAIKWLWLVFSSYIWWLLISCQRELPRHTCIFCNVDGGPKLAPHAYIKRFCRNLHTF